MSQISNMSPDFTLEVTRSSEYWIPKLLTISMVLSCLLILFSVVGAASLLFSFPLPFVQVVTDSGVVVNVRVK
jgi:hypothetical protein